MKTSHALLLGVTALSLALCACDKGDKPEAGAAPVVKEKKPKVEAPAEGGATANPQPPVPGEAPKAMDGGGAPGGVGEAGSGESGEAQIKMLNSAISAYAQKMAQKGMLDKMKTAGNKPPQGGMTMTSGSTAAMMSLKSLDQLVTAGILQRLPEAPAGKKFVLDPKTQQVRLENK